MTDEWMAEYWKIANTQRRAAGFYLLPNWERSRHEQAQRKQPLDDAPINR